MDQKQQERVSTVADGANLWLTSAAKSAESAGFSGVRDVSYRSGLCSSTESEMIIKSNNTQKLELMR